MNQRLRENGLLICLFVVILLQAAVGLALITTKNDLQNTVACQAAYNQQFSSTYRVRARAVSQSRAKLDNFLDYVFKANKKDPPNGSKELKRAQAHALDLLNSYLQKEKKIKATPVPPLPSSFCGRD